MNFTIINRMFRASKLDVELYEEVEADKSLLTEAMVVVILSSLASGIGSWSMGFGELFTTTIGELISWYVWAFIVYLIGTKLLPEPQTVADHGELLRTIGYSSAPGVIRILKLILPFDGAIDFLAIIWMLTAMIIAVRQALDYKSSLRSVLVCSMGLILKKITLSVVLILWGLLYIFIEKAV
jgi:hypothetical protein